MQDSRQPHIVQGSARPVLQAAVRSSETEGQALQAEDNGCPAAGAVSRTPIGAGHRTAAAVPMSPASLSSSRSSGTTLRAWPGKVRCPGTCNSPKRAVTIDGGARMDTALSAVVYTHMACAADCDLGPRRHPASLHNCRLAGWRRQDYRKTSESTGNVSAPWHWPVVFQCKI